VKAVKSLKLSGPGCSVVTAAEWKALLVHADLSVPSPACGHSHNRKYTAPCSDGGSHTPNVTGWIPEQSRIRCTCQQGRIRRTCRASD
jgi:hypothetical protein